MKNRMRFVFIFLQLGVVVFLHGCGLSNLGTNLNQAVLNHDDPVMISQALPSYLLMVDSLIEGDPGDEDWLRAGASMYSLYAATFVNESHRAKVLSERAFDYGQRALCSENSDGCGLTNFPFAAFESTLNEFDEDELPAMYSLALGWLVWAQNHSDDWGVVAALPKMERLLDRMIELDPMYENGKLWMYSGILYSLRPPAMGGNPDRARQCFEQALLVTEGRDLSVKVAYAQYYARLIYDRELHDRLLFEVRQADVHASGMTLMNVLAQQQAAQLLQSAGDYF
ncbi:TRAP transporter TatT component family protein [Desulfuromonas acetoxidans]|uniref:TRAP transporter TatT component family protein n=1 Tax=Desulfuromonas acetoxidans TaxID=891 RepID=UPI002930CCF6|nr:TRAP transporter TatT component family protein [Desulfuromonas acetoxidans]